MAWIEGLDYPWIHPSTKALLNYGAKFVCRYLSQDAAKDLSLGEANSLANAGIWMAVVYETTANRATQGRAAGAIDASRALAKAKACGMPEDRPIYFAVDFDAAGPEVADYFRGVGDVIKDVNRIGVYGGLRAVRHLHLRKLVKYVWQTYAWSGGVWYDTTHIRQYRNNIQVGGVDCDANRAQGDDYGQWMPGKSPVQPAPAKENDVQFGQLKNGAGAKDVLAVPQGSGTNIAFGADNSLQGLPPAMIRVAVRDAKGWDVHQVEVDGTMVGKDGKPNPVQAVVHFRDPKTSGVISIRREDVGDVNVGWEIS